jgi:SAM-dependent methyltransferase
VLIVTTICFVDDPRRMLAEVCRVLRPQGVLVVGFIDRTSWLGQQYEAHRQESIFYREATFFSAREVGDLLADAAFGEFARQQTLTRPLAEMTDIEPPRPGVGTGAFVAVRAVKAPS